MIQFVRYLTQYGLGVAVITVLCLSGIVLMAAVGLGLVITIVAEFIK